MCAGALPNLGSLVTPWEEAVFLCGPKDSCLSPETHSLLAASCIPGLLEEEDTSLGPRGCLLSSRPSELPRDVDSQVDLGSLESVKS